MVPDRDLVKGMLVGLLLPIMGFLVVKFIFSVLVHFGLLAEVTDSITERRLRTISLLAICFNLIPIQFIKKRKAMNLIRGIVLATLIFAAIWIWKFRESLFTL